MPWRWIRTGRWHGPASAIALQSSRKNGAAPAGDRYPRGEPCRRASHKSRSHLAEAYATLGLLRSRYDWKWDEAAVFFRRAIDLNPGYATAHFWYGFHYLAMTGRLERHWPRQNLLSRSIHCRSSPRKAVASFDGVAPLRGGIEQYRLLLEFEPSFYKAWTSRGRVYAQMGDYARAIEMYEKGLQLGGTIANILAALGQRTRSTERRIAQGNYCSSCTKCLPRRAGPLRDFGRSATCSPSFTWASGK